ncbi:MAG TPA: DoxX family membrane protein [Tenuifilaceae bacterium]|nr:DoxX family membrane protein [Tenuifilaceae bacterium]HPJ46669.1 DoxX family membrane protein [Tenuifilaceae bacterium]HPQ34838.1 DoxX family membrane protein [Tenuifilaceae bacterium]
MKTTKNTYEQSERIIAYWLNRNSLYLLRISIGIIFLWFGFLKFFPGLSPAQDLAIDTIAALTFGLVTPKFIIITLATWETVIGLGFLTGKFQRITLLLLFMHMLGTFAPMLIFPNEVFTRVPFAPTLEGQYIIKNIVIISAGLVIGAKVYGKQAD